MYDKIIEFEKSIFNIWINNDSCISNIDKEIIIGQYERCIHNIELTGVGFFDHISVSNDERKLSKEESVLGNIQVSFKTLNVDLGIAIFIREGCIKTIEFYTYEQEWYGDIESYDVYIVKENGELLLLESVEI